MRRSDERFRQALEPLEGRPPPDDIPTGWLDRVLKKQIVVHTVQDQSIEGVLMEATVDGVILRAARLLDSGGKGTSMAGEVWVPRTNIAFAQLDE